MGERLRGWAPRQTKSPHLWLVAVTTAVFSDMLDVWDGVDVRQKGAGSGAWDNSCGGEEWENKESVLVVGGGDNRRVGRCAISVGARWQ
jgi:hypothetical protein